MIMADSFPEIFKGLRAETQKAVVGYDEMLTHVLVCDCGARVGCGVGCAAALGEGADRHA